MAIISNNLQYISDTHSRGDKRYSQIRSITIMQIIALYQLQNTLQQCKAECFSVYQYYNESLTGLNMSKIDSWLVQTV